MEEKLVEFESYDFPKKKVFIRPSVVSVVAEDGFIENVTTISCLGAFHRVKGDVSFVVKMLKPL